MTTSVLESFPEHVKAIGMISIEKTNIDLALTHLLEVVLDVPGEVAQAIYMTPKQDHTRLQVFRNIMRSYFTPRHGAVVPDDLASVLDTVRKMMDDFYKRAEGLSNKRHTIIHDLWGEDGDKNVVRSSLPIKDYWEPGEIADLSELKNLVDQMRYLIDDIRAVHQRLWSMHLLAVGARQQRLPSVAHALTQESTIHHQIGKPRSDSP